MRRPALVCAALLALALPAAGALAQERPAKRPGELTIDPQRANDVATARLGDSTGAALNDTHDATRRAYMPRWT